MLFGIAVSACGGGGGTSSSPAATTTPVNTKLNDTGITASQCYQAGSDALVACSSAGAMALSNAQDGMAGRDVATNSNADGKLGFSFTSVTGGCVQDNVTGLMWEVKTANGDLRDWTKTYTNYSAADLGPTSQYGTATDASGFVTAVNASNLCGHSEWRLPTADELQSIVDYSVSSPGPTVDAIWFPNTQGSAFWSASPWFGGGTSSYIYNAFAVLFNSGAVYDTYGRTDTHFVRLVRAGQSQTPPRYTLSADGQEVTDNQTNLIWRRCAEGMVYSGGTCTGTARTFTHEAALQRASAQAGSPGIAWRLPNIKELSSIADKSFSPAMAIDPTAFPAMPGNEFWSASPDVGNSLNAWEVFFGDGFVGNYYGRNNTFYVRLVRASQ